MAVEFTAREISAKDDRFAPWYDWVEGVPDLLGARRLRRRLLRQASGKVLEVAVGTEKNLRYYPHNCRFAAVDVNGAMLNEARKRAAKLSIDVSFLLSDARFRKWRAFAERTEKFFCWSMDAAITNG